MKSAIVKWWRHKNLLNRGGRGWRRMRGRGWRWAKRAGIGVPGLFLIFLVLNRIFPVPDKIEYSTIVTDNKGDVIHVFLTRDQQWRMKTDLAEISPLLRKAIIEKEDKYFYY